MLLNTEPIKYTKPALSLDQQIQLLKERGLTVPDEAKLKKYLTHLWYFRLTGYFKYYQDTTTNRFYEGITFDEVLNVYLFDRKLRLLMLEVIEKIELSVKATICNYMSEKYDPFWYVNEELFDLTTDHKRQLFEETKKRAEEKKESSSAVFVKAYYEKYLNEQYLPIRMFVEECTLWEIRKLYMNLNYKDARAIASINYNMYLGDLKIRLSLLGTIRNISAHHARLWNRNYITRPRINDSVLKEKYTIEISENNIPEVVSNMFNTCLIIKYLLDVITPWNDFIARLKQLFSEYPMVNIKSMWFEEDWEEKLK